MNVRSHKKLFIRISFLISVLIISTLLLTGCVRGMSPIGWSGVLVSNGSLYAGSKDGRLISVDLSNNSLLFAEPLRAVSTGGSSCSSISGGSACGGAPPAIAIYGTPATASVPVFGNLVYIAGYNGKVFAYDAKTLQQRWVYPVDGNLAPIISTIAISGNLLYFGCTDKNLYALDTASGAFKWKFTTGGEIWSSPVVDNNTVFISSFDKKIYALDTATGNKKWDFSTEANNVATPVALNGLIYVGSLDRNLYAIDETTGLQVWKFPAGNWFWAKPVAINGIIFAPNLDSNVYGLDSKTGGKKVEYNVGGQVASWPVIVNNQVIIATENGKLIALSADPTSPTQKFIGTIPLDVTAPLSANNDTVYINGPDNIIYGYNVVTGAKLTPIPLKSQ